MAWRSLPWLGEALGGGWLWIDSCGEDTEAWNHLSGSVRKMRGSLVQGTWGGKGLWAVVTWGDLVTPGKMERSGEDRASGWNRGTGGQCGCQRGEPLGFVAPHGWTDPQLLPGS